ncbi:MAG: Dam family site-specific DNA-(adenine-N6)-methyltransferase, partial [Phycisphaerales bacterium]
YVEPFVGGGAVFFYIAQKYPKLKNFYLFDINNDLVNCYKTIKTNVESIIEELEKLQNGFLSHNDKRKFYNDVRSKFNHDKAKNHSPETMAKLIFLNKTCFNGLYRVNSKNEFNVPFGDYKNPKICDRKNLLAVSEILRKAKIICGDFTKSDKYIDKKTFVYLDPPYRPIGKTANFTSYSKDSFSEADQIRLAKYCITIAKTHAKFLLSNSETKDDFFQTHYTNFKIETVSASRLINCQASGRGKINELLITN